MLIGPKLCSAIMPMALVVGLTNYVCGTADSHSTLSSSSYNATIAQALPRAHNQQTAGSPSDAVVQSLERAIVEGRTQEANDLLMQVLKRPHLTSDFLLRLGIRFAEREWYRAASEIFQRCIRDSPGIFEAYYDLALTDIAQQKWQDALAILQQAPQRSRSEILACSYLRGKLEDSQGKTDEAERDFSFAFEGAPQNPTYGMDLGLFYIHQHAYPRAVAVFKQSADLHSHSSFLLLGLAVSQFLAGQHEQSLKTLRKLLALQPDFAPAQVFMTFVLSEEGKLEEAEEIARRGLDSRNASPYLYYLDASILVKLQSRQHERILRELSIAQRNIPSCALCYLTASKAHQAQGNFEAAIADLESATRLDPSFTEAWYRLASLYRHVGRSADASRAQARFQELKADKEEREVRMLRENFLETLDSADAAQ